MEVPRNPVQCVNFNTPIPMETSNINDPFENELLQEDNTEDSNSTPTGTDNGNTNNPPQSEGKRRGKRTINILEDPIVKVIKYWEFEPLILNFKVFAKTFPGATTQDVTDYVKPSVNHEPDIIFCH